MKKIILLLISLITCGCSNQFLSDKELNNIIKENNYVILDVRTEEEYNNIHIRDAINIPYDEINEKTELDKNKIILVYCQSGKRSNIAYKTLKDLEYKVYDLGSINTIKLEKI